MRRTFILLVIINTSLINYSQIIADHTVVDKFSNIPQYYIDQVKKMWVTYPGESHSQDTRDGMIAFTAANPAYAMNSPLSGTPEAYTTAHLRYSRATWGDINNTSGWIYDYGEEDWFNYYDGTYHYSAAAVARTEANLTYCNSNGLILNATGFGWCWDYNDGLNADWYLTATQAYIDYCTSQGYSTKVFFTTGPQGFGGVLPPSYNYVIYQRAQQIRSYVNSNPARILFDWQDILAYNDAGVLATESDGIHTFPSYNASNDGGAGLNHIGTVGAIRLAKAMWWLLARIAGWDGGLPYVWLGTVNDNFALPGNWQNGAVPADGSDISFSVNAKHNCLLDKDRTLKNITSSQGTYRLVLNGHQLTLLGNLIFSGGAQIDASTVLSTIIYNGQSSQTIESGQLLNNRVSNLGVSNTNGVSLNTDFTIDNSLTINSGSFIIPTPRSLTVSGTLSNNAGNSGLLIKSDINGNCGKLINNNSSYAGTVELNLSGGLVRTAVGRFHYIVPPVVSMVIGTSIAQAKSYLSLANFNGDLLDFDEPKATPGRENGWQYFDNYGSTTGFSSISSTRGYNIYLTSDDKITFKGQLIGPAQSFNLNYTSSNPSPGWNLVGNPYPCSYRLHGIPQLLSSDNVDNTVYFTHDGAYGCRNVKDSTYVGLTAYSDIVAPMQGFFVHVTANTSISLPVDHKTLSNANPLRSKGGSSGKSNSIKKIKLALNNGTLADETIICLINDATDGFDSDHDAYKIFGSGSGTETPYIYTELNTIKYAINAINEQDSGSHVVPVTVEIKSSGTYKIDITEFENLEGLKVILKHGEAETILSKDASYQFSSAAGIFTDFHLIISKNITKVENYPVEIFNIWYANNILNIKFIDGISSKTGNLNICDISGKMYFNTMLQISPGQTIHLPLDLPNGIFITDIRANNKHFVKKIVNY